MKKVFENFFAEIYDISDEIPHTVFAYWKGFLTLENQDAVDACQFSLDYFKEAGIKVMISDHVHLEGATVEFLDWLHAYYFPTCVANGLLSEIVLESAHDIGNITLDLMYDKEDLQKYLKANTLYTPKVKGLDKAKQLARAIVEEAYQTNCANG
ncbi:MAG: hypothetical protein RMJ87_03020 [Cytophagales bacterium]|nr:DUF4286 family protein [Bernardetiaceae bacterium]MDW8203978.1 hypothetical protein [Cytophagales bacterium]